MSGEADYLSPASPPVPQVFSMSLIGPGRVATVCACLCVCVAVGVGVYLYTSNTSINHNMGRNYGETPPPLVPRTVWSVLELQAKQGVHSHLNVLGLYICIFVLSLGYSDKLNLNFKFLPHVRLSECSGSALILIYSYYFNPLIGILDRGSKN